MSDRQLRKQLIRLAHRRPELRDDLLPLLSRTAAKASPEVEAFFEGMLEKVHSTDHPNRVKRSGDSIYAEFGDAAITVMHNRRMDTVCTDIEGRTYCNPVEAANALEDLMRDQRENRPMRSAASDRFGAPRKRKTKRKKTKRGPSLTQKRVEKLMAQAAPESRGWEDLEIRKGGRPATAFEVYVRNIEVHDYDGGEWRLLKPRDRKEFNNYYKGIAAKLEKAVNKALADTGLADHFEADESWESGDDSLYFDYTNWFSFEIMKK